MMAVQLSVMKASQRSHFIENLKRSMPQEFVDAVISNVVVDDESDREDGITSSAPKPSSARTSPK
jgi:hypothetical protein